MLNRLLFSLAFTFNCTCVPAQNPVPFTEATFHKLIGRFMKDPVAFFDKDCTADFVGIGVTGKRGSRENNREMFRSFVCVKRDYNDLLIRQYGSTGVMTGKTTSVYQRKDGSTFTHKDYWTQLFVWQNNAWKMAGYQATALDNREAAR